MSEMQHAFFSATKHKRKRSENDISGIAPDRVIKRPTNLAFRSSPKSRPTSLFSNISACSPFSGQLTPVDTSEDESVTQEDIGKNNCRVPNLSDSVESASSIKVHISSPESQHGQSSIILDSDMEATSSTPVRPRIGRARSNDLLSSPPRRLTPQRAASLLSPDSSTTAFPNDRIPTPISGDFSTHLTNIPSVPRHSFAPIHTNLSPMIEQDNWSSLNSATQSIHHRFGQNSLPSPADDEIDDKMFSNPASPTLRIINIDGDADMQLDEATTSSMSSLRVSGDGDDAMDTDHKATSYAHSRSNSSSQQRNHHQPQRSGWAQQTPGHTRNTSSQSGRTARLHMGFMAGCEKCLQKVPGHYSHILWSKE